MTKRRQQENTHKDVAQPETPAPAPSLTRQFLWGLPLLLITMAAMVYAMLRIDFEGFIFLYLFLILPIGLALPVLGKKLWGDGGSSAVRFGLLGGFAVGVMAVLTVTAGDDFDASSRVENAQLQVNMRLVQFTNGVVRPEYKTPFTGANGHTLAVVPVVPENWTPDKPVTLWVTGEMGLLPPDLPQRWQQGQRGGILQSADLNGDRFTLLQRAVNEAKKSNSLKGPYSAAILEWREKPLAEGQRRATQFWILGGVVIVLWFGWVLLRESCRKQGSLFESITMENIEQ